METKPLKHICAVCNKAIKEGQPNYQILDVNHNDFPRNKPEQICSKCHSDPEVTGENIFNLSLDKLK